MLCQKVQHLSNGPFSRVYSIESPRSRRGSHHHRRKRRRTTKGLHKWPHAKCCNMPQHLSLLRTLPSVRKLCSRSRPKFRVRGSGIQCAPKILRSVHLVLDTAFAHHGHKNLCEDNSSAAYQKMNTVFGLSLRAFLNLNSLCPDFGSPRPRHSK